MPGRGQQRELVDRQRPADPGSRGEQHPRARAERVQRGPQRAGVTPAREPQRARDARAGTGADGDQQRVVGEQAAGARPGHAAVGVDRLEHVGHGFAARSSAIAASE